MSIKIFRRHAWHCLRQVCGGKRDRSPSLFAVGDDWQAIYRFAGSDVSLTTDFLARFPKGEIRYLDTTYRFNSMLGDVANRFIQVNPTQLSKPLNSHRLRRRKRPLPCCPLSASRQP
ncbi:hypothetical protein P4S70_08500 [Enterovibrio sp. Hal110]